MLSSAALPLQDDNVTHPNAILHLRETALAVTTKPFRARGSRLKRCGHCLMAETLCICAHRRPTASRAAFCFLLYRGEAFKPSNTGRLIADIVPEHHAFLWSRTEADPALLALLTSERYHPIVVFPHPYAEAARHIHHPDAVGSDRPPLFIVLDGTWREARKMFNSPYLQHLPVLGIATDRPSGYLMRDAAWQFQWCTAEIGIELLALAGDHAAAQSLSAYFRVFCDTYLRVRAPLALKRRGDLPTLD